MGDDRRTIDDPAPTMRVHRGQLGELMDRIVVRRGAQGLLEERSSVLPAGTEDRHRVDVAVEHVDRAHRGEFGHPAPVRADGTLDRVTPVVLGEAARSAGQDQARGEPLEVPLERSPKGLVEIGDVEDLRPFW